MEVLVVRDMIAKERCMETSKKKRNVKMCLYESEKERNEHFRWKRKRDVSGIRKLFFF